MVHNPEVAPYVGAWIETQIVAANEARKDVAPYVGAWIETSSSEEEVTVNDCRTLRGCVD